MQNAYTSQGQTHLIALSQSDDYSNHNLYLFLNHFYHSIPPMSAEDEQVIKALFEDIPEEEFIPALAPYDANTRYSELYLTLLKKLEKVEWQPENTAHQTILNAFYSNMTIPKTMAERLVHLPSNLPGENAFSTLISAAMKDFNHERTSPLRADNLKGKYEAYVGDYSPLTFNLPTLSPVSLKIEDRTIKRQRMGIPAFISDNCSHISPIYKAWVASRKQGSADNLITDIYFDFLADSSKIREKNMSYAMHVWSKEGELPSNLAIISLPANGSLFKEAVIDESALKYSHQEALEQVNDLLNPFKEKSAFKASPQALAALETELSSLGPATNINEKYQGILKDFFKDALLQMRKQTWTEDPSEKLSKADLQAMVFYISRYLIPMWLMSSWKDVENISMTCRDGIDRGGISSAFLHLVHSFEEHQEQPLTEQAFEAILHTPALCVKARGVNRHLKTLWNAVHHYVEAHIDQLWQDPKKRWLIFWRNMNCPKSQVKNVLNCFLEHIPLPPTSVDSLSSLPSALDTEAIRKDRYQRLFPECITATKEALQSCQFETEDYVHLLAICSTSSRIACALEDANQDDNICPIIKKEIKLTQTHILPRLQTAQSTWLEGISDGFKKLFSTIREWLGLTPLAATLNETRYGHLQRTSLTFANFFPMESNNAEPESVRLFPKVYRRVQSEASSVSVSCASPRP